MRRRHGFATPRRLSLGAVAIVGAGMLVAVFGFGVGNRADAASNRIVVSDSGCGFDWSAPRAGRTVFTVENTSKTRTYGVTLIRPDGSSIYGQIDALAPSTDLPLDVVLPAGEYAFSCVSTAGYSVVSPSREMKGTTSLVAHPYEPVTNLGMQFAMLGYRASLVPVLTRLAVDTDALVAAVSRGDLAGARRLWLPAHLDYSELGAAYDTFGQFNDEINGRPLGLEGGTGSPDFHGFLRLEYGLWHGQSAAVLRPVAAALGTAVHGLVERFPHLTIPTGDLSLRAHEILENTLQFELTGETDEGSNTNLATAWANVRGTELAVDALSPLLRQAHPALARDVRRKMTRLETMLAAYRRPAGWVGLDSLTTGERERLDGAMSGLLEQLALIPDVLQPAPSGSGDG